MKKKTVGVIIGRFQTPFLHEGHMELFQYVQSQGHHQVAVILGQSPTRGTKRDPMDAATRRLLLEKVFFRANVGVLDDVGSDILWSQNLDTLLQEMFPGYKCVLYGGRHSFIPHYKGKHKTHKVPINVAVSATNLRKQIVESGPMESMDFRAGVIYAAETQFPRVFMTVDLAIFDEKGLLLLGQKHKDEPYCLPGGFVDPTDESLEMAARRELAEEAGANLEVGIRYAGSHLVEDWRYTGQERIMTALFVGTVVFGYAIAGDDLASIRWVDPKNLKAEDIIPSHRKLVREAIRAHKAELNRRTDAEFERV